MLELESLCNSTLNYVHRCVREWMCVCACKCFHRKDLQGVVKKRKAIKVKGKQVL